MFKSVLLLGAIVFSATSWATSSLCTDDNENCTFVLASESSLSHVVNQQRAQTRLTPYSTFKIANALIGLERGVIKHTKQTLSFDKSKYIPQAWWPPVWKLPRYDLNSAFKYSMVSVFRQLAVDIGQPAMAQQVKRLNYGNGDISSGLDSFWLGGSLQISALEQIKFLQGVYHNTFNLKPSSLAALKEIMLVEETQDYKIYAKTGAGKLENKSMLGWYVGFVETEQGVHFFSANITAPTYAQVKTRRVEMVMAHLRKQGVL